VGAWNKQQEELAEHSASSSGSREISRTQQSPNGRDDAARRRDAGLVVGIVPTFTKGVLEAAFVWRQSCRGNKGPLQAC
jgi:hypothetical protein